MRPWISRPQEGQIRRRRRISRTFLPKPDITIKKPTAVVERMKISAWTVIPRCSFCVVCGFGKPDAGARAGAPGSTTRGAGDRIRGCRAPSWRDLHGRAFPEHSSGQLLLRAGEWRTSGAGGAGGSVLARDLL